MKYMLCILALFLIVRTPMAAQRSSLPAQEKDTSAAVKETAQQTMTVERYVCPMHPEYVFEQSGKCPKCGMALVKKMVQASDSTGMKYTCPMHSDVVSIKPGKCPKCKMDLVRSDKGSKN